MKENNTKTSPSSIIINGKPEALLYKAFAELVNCENMYDFIHFKIKYKMKKNFISRLCFRIVIYNARKKNRIDDTEAYNLKQMIIMKQNIGTENVDISNLLIDHYMKRCNIWKGEMSSD